MAPKTRPPDERFTEHTRQMPNGCIEWTAYRGDNGYGRFYLAGKGVLAHRWSYENACGTIPAGMQIDHLCRNRACVNPEHLEPVTPSENVRRSSVKEAAQRRSARTTHCPHGHEYTDENTYRGSGARVCWTCKREARRRHYIEHRPEYLARAAAQRRAKKVS